MSRSPQREGFRSVEHLKRYTTLGMATDQGKTSNVNGLGIMAELHGRSHPADGTTTFRPPYTPVAIGALARPPPRQGLPPDPPARRARLGRGAGRVLRREPATGCARNGSRGPARPTGSQSCQPRGEGGPQRRRHLRCLDAGQDRHPGRGRRRLPGPPLHQHVLDAGRRPGALRPDAARGRVRASTTARHRASATTHYLMTTTTANAGKVMQHIEYCHAVAVAGPRRADRLGNRAMGAVRRRRAALARRCCAASSIAGTISPTRPSPTWRPASVTVVGGVPGAPVPHLLLGRARLRDRRARRLWRRAGARAHGGGARLRRRALRRRGDGRHAHREGPRRGRRTQRPDHGARSRPRQDDVDARRTSSAA